MNKFRLGMITGMSSLVLAVPLLSVAAYAQSSEPTDQQAVVPTQTCVEAMANLEQAHLDQFDLMNDKRKEEIQTRVNALNAAAAITDDAARQEALKQLRESQKAARDAMKDEIPASLQTAMDAVKSACGDTFKMRVAQFGDEHPRMGHMMDRAPGFIAEKLGMTEDELKDALESGKTIKEIAEEKGIDLPAPPQGRGMMRDFFMEKLDQ